VGRGKVCRAEDCSCTQVVVEVLRHQLWLNETSLQARRLRGLSEGARETYCLWSLEGQLRRVQRQRSYFAER